MSDKHHLCFLEEGIIDIMIERMRSDVDSTVIMMIRALARLATKSKLIFDYYHYV